MNERISWASIACLSGYWTKDCSRLIMIDHELGIPRESFRDIRWRRASPQIRHSSPLCYCWLVLKVPLSRLGCRSDHVGLFPAFHGIGGIEEEFGGFWTWLFIVFAWTYKNGFPASIMLAFMLAAYYSDRILPWYTYDAERASLQMVIHLRFGTADLFSNCRFGRVNES